VISSRILSVSAFRFSARVSVSTATPSSLTSVAVSTFPDVTICLLAPLAVDRRMVAEKRKGRHPRPFRGVCGRFA
jgi:hypothetical protein